MAKRKAFTRRKTYRRSTRRKLQNGGKPNYRRRGTVPFIATAARTGYNALKGLKRMRSTVRSVNKYLQKRRKFNPANSSSNELTRSNKRMQIQKYSLNRVVNCIKSTDILRFQGVTNFDTNSGYFPLRNSNLAGNVTIQLPVHLYHLNLCPTGGTYPGAGWTSGWAAEANTSAVESFAILGQTATGVSTDSKWQLESLPSNNVQRGDSFIHEWTQVKLNLYGARKRTTRFTVSFFYVSKAADPLATAGTVLERKELVQYLSRPYIYSNLLADFSHQKKHIQIVKEFNYTVDATDGFDLNTTTGKIHNANIFIRHNKRYKLDEGVFNTTILPHGQADGSDFDTRIDAEITGIPKPGRRLYMCIRAFAPERVDGATGINALTDPSYDMILRNAVTKV